MSPPTPESRPRDDPRPPIPACIQDEIRLKNRLRRQWQITRDLDLKAEVNHFQRSVTHQLNEWRNDQWSDTLESLDPEDQLLWKMTRRMMRIPNPPLIEKVAEALQAYSYAPASDPKSTNPMDVQDAIRALKVGKARDPMVHRTGL
jgi:hypothetical protein